MMDLRNFKSAYLIPLKEHNVLPNKKEVNTLKEDLEKLKKNTNEVTDHLNKFVDEIDFLIEEGKSGYKCVIELWDSITEWFSHIYESKDTLENKGIDVPEEIGDVVEVIREETEDKEVEDKKTEDKE